MASNPAASKTLFDRVGGEENVRKLVERFYDCVLSDPELGRFFENTPMERLQRMQFEFFSAALDGPVAYSGRPINYAHYGRGITPKHLGRFLDHMLATLKDQNLTEQEVYDIIARINKYSDEITGTAPAEG
jgi:hemoglobin